MPATELPDALPAGMSGYLSGSMILHAQRPVMHSILVRPRRIDRRGMARDSDSFHVITSIGYYESPQICTT